MVLDPGMFGGFVPFGTEEGQQRAVSFAQGLASLAEPFLSGKAWKDYLKSRNTKKDDVPLTDEEKTLLFEAVEENIRKYLPVLVLVGIFIAFKKWDKKGSVDLIALSNIIGSFSVPLTAYGWFLLTRVNKTAELLSYVIAAAETTPTIDLGLPPGVTLGSYFVVGEDMVDLVGGASEFLEGKDLTKGVLFWPFYLAEFIAGGAGIDAEYPEWMQEILH